MDLAARRERYAAIESYRKRPLIVYATSTRANVRSMMAGDAVREFIDQVEAISEGNAVDVLIHSTGGDGLAAWKLMSVLRERFEKVDVLVPSMAFSAATIFALGADEIVMHPHASLGPIDPQIEVRQPDGTIRRFAYEDLGAFIQFLRDDVKLSEQEHLTAVVDKLFASTDPVVVGAAKRASNLAAEVGERLLLMHMKDHERKAKQIAQNLAKSFFAHSDAVSRSRAKQLDLQIAAADPVLEGLMWSAYLALEEHMEFRTPFHPLGIFMSDPRGASSLAAPPVVSLPANVPLQIAQGVRTQVANQALMAPNPGVAVPCTCINAVVESVRLASEVRMSGSITATRQPSGEIRINVLDPGSAWKPVEEPGVPTHAGTPGTSPNGSPHADSASIDPTSGGALRD